MTFARSLPIAFRLAGPLCGPLLLSCGGVVEPETVAPDVFVPEEVPLGDPGVAYLDPEILSSAHRLVFQTVQGGSQRIWIADLDPSNGLFKSEDGLDLLVDSGVATLGPNQRTNNGPEWGWDSGGASVFYSKPDAQGTAQVWRATGLSPGAVDVTQLTRVTGSHAVNVCVRRDPTRPTTQFFYRFAEGPEHPGPARWADETDPTAIHGIPAFSAAGFAPSWIEGTEDFAFTAFTSPTTSEVARHATASGANLTLVDAPEVVKRNVQAFRAPEMGGQRCIAYVADATALEVVCESANGYAHAATLAPEDPVLRYLYSPEVFQVAGTTYVAVLVQDSPDYHTASAGAIYVLGLGADAGRRLRRRVDDGTPANRSEPEPYVGAQEVFVYFSVGGALRRARTGIPTGGVGGSP